MPEIKATEHILIIIVAYWKIKKKKKNQSLDQNMVLKIEPFKKLERGGIHGFKVGQGLNWRSKCDDIIIFKSFQLVANKKFNIKLIDIYTL